MDEKVKRAMDNLWHIKMGRRDKVVPIGPVFDFTPEEKAFYLDKFKKGEWTVELYRELKNLRHYQKKCLCRQ